MPAEQSDQPVDPGQRIVVVGDLHGMVHKVKALWRSLEAVLQPSGLLAAHVVFLGDYCDRGLYTRELLNWLASLQLERDRRGARTTCLLGNHEFCLLAFLGMLPKPQADPGFNFRLTWDREDASKNERERWWGSGQETPDVDDIHLQGRRWGGSYYERSYGSPSTFASYGVPWGDRQALLKAMPEEHLDFLRRCPWIHIEDHKHLGRLVFVHAGLEADGSAGCEEQISRLRERDATHVQPGALFGREGVLHTPPQLARGGTTVVSGHHGKVMLKAHRIVLDSCCGDERNVLSAMVLPDMLLVQHDGKVEARDPRQVFPERSKARHRQGMTPSLSAPTSPMQPRRQEWDGSPSSPFAGDGDTLLEGAGRTDSLSSATLKCSMPLGDCSPLEE